MPRIEALERVADAAGQELRVVLTVRGLASVIPSEWQQFLKHRMTLDYPTFLKRVQNRNGRWARALLAPAGPGRDLSRAGPTSSVRDRIDVVVTPDRTEDPDGLYRMFGQVVGFDPHQLSWPDRNVNASWGYVEAEVYRRTNEALGDRLPRLRARLPARPAGGRSCRGCSPASASDRIPLPPTELEWVTHVAREHVTWLADSGIRVHGDPSAADPLPGRHR